MPGEVLSHRESWRLIASAISRAGPGHRLQGFLRADLLDRAEQLEELQVEFGQEADSPGDEPTAGRVAFEVLGEVERNLPAGVQLQLSANGLRDEHLVLERPDLDAGLVIQNAGQGAGHSGEHCYAPFVSGPSSMSSGSSPSNFRKLTPV